MKRYLHLYLAILKVSFHSFFAYRFDAFMNTFFSSGIWTLFNVFSMYLVTLRSESVFGWRRGELILISCIYNIVIGVFSFIFARSISQFAELVDKGRLDLFLLRPIDSQFYVSTHTANANSLFRTLLGIVMAIVVIVIYHIPITLLNVLYFIVGSTVAIVLLYSLLFILNTIVIWSPRLDNINDLFYTLRSLGRYPRESFRQLSEVAFVFVSPFVMVMATPARLLLGKASLYSFGELVVYAIFFFIISRLFWKFALRFYTSASS